MKIFRLLAKTYHAGQKLNSFRREQTKLLNRLVLSKFITILSSYIMNDCIIPAVKSTIITDCYTIEQVYKRISDMIETIEEKLFMNVIVLNNI